MFLGTRTSRTTVGSDLEQKPQVSISTSYNVDGSEILHQLRDR